VTWRRLAICLAWLGCSGVAAAQSLGGLGSLAGETDADRFTAVRARAGGLFDYVSPLKYFGVAAQNTSYGQSGWHRDATGVVGLWRDQAPDTLAGINAELGAVEIGGRTRPVGDIAWGLRPATATGIELLAAAGLVETRPAIDQGIGYSFFGASIEQTLAARLTVIALAAYQPFTDGNDRVHVRARMVWDAWPEQGINMQVRWRQYRSRKIDVGGSYFDPESYQQWLGVVGFRKRMSGWVTSGAIGAGQEFIRNQGTTTQPAYLAELRTEGTIAGDVRLALQAVYSRSAGFSDTPDYWYAQLGVTLMVPFR